MLVCLLFWLPSCKLASGWLCPLTPGHCSASCWPQYLLLFLLLGSGFVAICAYYTLINRHIPLGTVKFIIYSKSSTVSYGWSKPKMLSIHSHEAVLLGSHFKTWFQSVHILKSAFGKLIALYCMNERYKGSLDLDGYVLFKCPCLKRLLLLLNCFCSFSNWISSLIMPYVYIPHTDYCHHPPFVNFLPLLSSRQTSLSH